MNRRGSFAALRLSRYAACARCRRDKPILEQIERLKCQGVFGLEYAPSIDQDVSLSRTLASISKRGF